MKAIILVAGYATRLYPLTKDKPKALLPVCGKGIIDYILDEINTITEIDEIYVVSNKIFYDQFLMWKNSANTDKKLSVLNDGTVDNEGRLGAIGDINLAIDSYKIDDDLLIIAGDNLFNYKLGDFVKFFNENKKDCVCGKESDNVEMLKSFAVATLDDNNKILDLEEKPSEPKGNIAIYATYLYKRETLPLFKKYLDDGNNKDAPGYFVEWLYKRQDVLAYKFFGDCVDIGTFDAYMKIKDNWI